MQGSGFAWLGTYYIEVAQDTARAQKCFQRALSLDPLQRAAGILQLHLENHHQKSNQEGAELIKHVHIIAKPQSRHILNYCDLRLSAWELQS